MITKKYSWWHSTFNERQKEALALAFEKQQFTYGTICEEFEERFAKLVNKKYAVVTNSGTSALAMALIASSMGETKKILIPNLGWIATLQAAEFTNANIEICDVKPDAPLMDLSSIQPDDNFDLILPVHFNGRLVDIAEIAKRYPNATIVEDCCKALMSRYGDGSVAGQHGAISCFSFGMISLLSASYGGVCATDSLQHYESLKEIRWHGVVQNDSIANHEIYLHKSFNFKPSGLLTSLALAGLDDLDNRLAYVENLQTKYRECLREFSANGLRFVNDRNATNEVSILMDVECDHLGTLIEYLSKKGIQTMRYHPPISRAKMNFSSAIEKNARNIYSRTLHLPSGILRNDLDDDYFDFLQSTLKNFYKT